MERSGYWLHKWTDETSSCDPHGRWSGGLDCYERDYSMWIPDRIKPDDTVAVNDYIDRQFELSAEVADGLEVIDAADAQATIAALQARVQELEDAINQEPRVKATCWPPEAQRLWESCNRLIEKAEAKVMFNYLEKVEQRAMQAEAQLTQRRAELEAARKWKIELCNLTPGGSEFADDPAYCAEWVRKVRENQHDIILNKCREAKSLKAELERVRGLIKALPKVEGEIEVSSGVYNFILLKHDSGTGFLCGQIETEQTARAIAALWKHRQGME